MPGRRATLDLRSYCQAVFDLRRKPSCPTAQESTWADVASLGGRGVFPPPSVPDSDTSPPPDSRLRAGSRPSRRPDFRRHSEKTRSDAAECIPPEKRRLPAPSNASHSELEDFRRRRVPPISKRTTSRRVEWRLSGGLFAEARGSWGSRGRSTTLAMSHSPEITPVWALSPQDLRFLRILRFHTLRRKSTSIHSARRDDALARKGRKPQDPQDRQGGQDPGSSATTPGQRPPASGGASSTGRSSTRRELDLGREPVNCPPFCD